MEGPGNATKDPEKKVEQDDINRIASVGYVSEGDMAKRVFTTDEYQLAQLGYKQEFLRSLGFFESWAATFSSMNYASGIAVLFGFAMFTGGPTAAFANWTMVGGLSTLVALSMAEIAAALPTCGGIYFWAFQLGGEQHGPFLAWMTGWWNWAGWITVVPGVQQGATNFLLSALEIQYPEATILTKGWFIWLLTSLGMAFSMAPNVINANVLRWYFRFAIAIFHVLVVIYWVWFPIEAHRKGGFQPASGVFNHYYNGINLGEEKQASDSYSYIITLLFGAWIFYGYDASVHLAEETNEASDVVAKGMWVSTLSAWLMSVPTLIIILFCIQDFDGIVAGTYTNNWAEYLVQLVGPNAATGILALLWVDSTCATASCFMSAQRVTYAISRDGMLPFSKYFCRLSRNSMPVNAAYLVVVMSIIITLPIVGSVVAFSAITATATIATNASYLFPIIARQTVGRKSFRDLPSKWSLGRLSLPIAIVSSLYIMFLIIVLLLPQLYPVTAATLNYAPVMIGGITIISVAGWWLPFGLGGRHWFKGPQKTITELELEGAVVMDKYNVRRTEA